MGKTLACKHIVVRENDELPELDEADKAALERFALANLAEDDSGVVRPVLAARNRRLYAKNHVGIIETHGNTVVEILPKVAFGSGKHMNKNEEEEETRRVFLDMLRPYRAMRFAEFNETSIRALHRFSMLDVFVRLFLEDLAQLTKRGLARHYDPVEDNLPYLRGRVMFPQHIRLNAANGARFYVAFDEFTANRPVNRLIRATIERLRTAAHPDHRQVLHELRVCFQDVPPSSHPEVDWQRHRIDRGMRHYDTVMAWVRLFLFDDGLATFAGEHVNRALLFPMEQVFEDFVTDAFSRYQSMYAVRSQKPQRHFAKKVHAKTGTKEDAFRMKPDIALLCGGKVHYVLDAKWKELDGASDNPKHGVTQADVYQLYSYARAYGCRAVALVYPRTQAFDVPLHYEFKDGVDNAPLALSCLPFDVTQPKRSVAESLCYIKRPC